MTAERDVDLDHQRPLIDTSPGLDAMTATVTIGAG